ncbi:TonB-dependent receptor [Nibrella viscosa]|uniref:TonB-dependent receptor n=1 Tax=Nibrella viscosa TaxID=1084524 RepID=A0ABP8KTE2_9BACT
MRCVIVVLLFFGLPYCLTAQTQVTLNGYVAERGSQEALVGVSVYVPGTTLGTTTNTYGFFSLTIPARDSVTVTFSFVGYQSVTYLVALHRNVALNVTLIPNSKELTEVVVTASRDKNRVSDDAQMSQIGVPIDQIRNLPALMGEKDVIKVIQLMPGVQKGSEGSTGLYVRGGGPDQNLLILDDALVYNAQHLFGFFSVFNGNALKNVELIKGGFPARYGGRLSSVIEMNMKEGDKQQLHLEGGIGVVASNVTVEGPLQKNKSSFLVAVRRTYLDALAQPLSKAFRTEGLIPNYYFYDINAKLNYQFGQRDKVYVSGYLGHDQFRSQSPTNGNRPIDAGLNWGNATATLRWNHLFSERLFANTSLVFSNYRFIIEQRDRNPASDAPLSVYSLSYNSAIRDISLKQDFDFYPSPRHTLRFGLKTTFHRFTPDAIVVKDGGVTIAKNQVISTDVLESGIYLEDAWRPEGRWRLNTGLRLSHFLYGNRHYLRPEPRLSAACLLLPDLSVKASFAVMNQYVHLLSNTGTGFPTDLWVPTTNRIKPQQSWQAALGIAKDFPEQDWTLTVEGYYKTMDQIISYREGASFLRLNTLESGNPGGWENNVTAGKGWSYGAEVLLQKKVGRLAGWLGYTLSRTQWQFAELNEGQPFYPKYDRRHDVSLVGTYTLTPRIVLSVTWVYGTGNALTVPVGRYIAYLHEGTAAAGAGKLTIPPFDGGSPVIDYSQKNSFRAEAYHRMDLSLQFRKYRRQYERTWEFSIYNLYNQRNPFFYALGTKERGPGQSPQTVLYKYSVFSLLPSVSYKFRL